MNDEKQVYSPFNFGWNHRQLLPLRLMAVDSLFSRLAIPPLSSEQLVANKTSLPRKRWLVWEGILKWSKMTPFQPEHVASRDEEWGVLWCFIYIYIYLYAFIFIHIYLSQKSDWDATLKLAKEACRRARCVEVLVLSTSPHHRWPIPYPHETPDVCCLNSHLGWWHPHFWEESPGTWPKNQHQLATLVSNFKVLDLLDEVKILKSHYPTWHGGGSKSRGARPKRTNPSDPRRPTKERFARPVKRWSAAAVTSWWWLEHGFYLVNSGLIVVNNG